MALTHEQRGQLRSDVQQVLYKMRFVLMDDDMSRSEQVGYIYGSTRLPFFGCDWGGKQLDLLRELVPHSPEDVRAWKKPEDVGA